MSITEQISSTQLVYPGATNVTACVAGATSATPTGTIQIDSGTTVLTTLTLGGNGCAYWYISPGLNAGTYSISSVYFGDRNNPAGISPPTVLTISPVPVNMSVSCWNSSFSYGGNYQCTVNVSSNAGSAQGNITYSYDGGTPVAVPLSSGNAQFTITKPAAGSRQPRRGPRLCTADELRCRDAPDRELHCDADSGAGFLDAVHLVGNRGNQHHLQGLGYIVERVPAR
jgi:hypothetical protein